MLDNLTRRVFVSCVVVLFGVRLAQGLQILASSQKHSLVMPPPNDKRSLPNDQHTAVILLPGCLVHPHQYKGVAEQIQKESKQAVWVGVPKLFLDIANPLTLPSSIQRSITALNEAGYEGKKAFVGGHSLGGTFLPSIFGKRGLSDIQVEGLIYLGCFLNRDSASDAAVLSVPRLTVSGDLDGLVRASRIAEDFYRHVVVEGDTEKERLQHAVVLVNGMNHFSIVSGKAPFMESFRDLKPEISHAESVQAVGSTIAEFVDTHQQTESAASQKNSLLKKIDKTHQYLKPIMAAMELEGSYHINTPCHKCDDEDGSCDIDCVDGSAWAANVQHRIGATALASISAATGEVKDEFHESWWFNPFADPPFHHPKVETEQDSSYIKMETISEAVYEKTDFFFDGGFFSNTATEIRSKFNSPQSILHALGIKAPFEPVKNACSKLNQESIDWALQNAPDVVRKRYAERGIKMRVGQDIQHKSGPAWIWSYLQFRPDVCDEEEECRIIDSHTMSTPLDHPVPFVGGKLYCKLLSPAKALDWMYTDSLRDHT